MRNTERPDRNWGSSWYPTLDELRELNESNTRAIIRQILTGQAYVYSEIGEIDNSIPGDKKFNTQLDIIEEMIKRLKDTHK